MYRLEQIHLPPDAPSGVSIRRDEHGVPHIAGTELEAVLGGLGFCHALDRGLQLLLTRIIGQGRLGKRLTASDDALEIDRFFRKLNCRGGADAEHR